MLRGMNNGPDGPDWTTRPQLTPGRIPEMKDRAQRLQDAGLAKDQLGGGTPEKIPAIYKRGAK